MGLLLYVKGEKLEFELTNHEITSYEFAYKAPNSKYAKGSEDNRSLKIVGNISRIIETNQEILTLIRDWSKKEYAGSDYYNSVKVVYVYREEIIRETTFPNAFIVEYKESINPSTGHGTFTMVFNQKLDKLTDIIIEPFNQVVPKLHELSESNKLQELNKNEPNIEDVSYAPITSIQKKNINRPTKEPEKQILIFVNKSKYIGKIENTNFMIQIKDIKKYFSFITSKDKSILKLKDNDWFSIVEFAKLCGIENKVTYSEDDLAKSAYLIIIEKDKVNFWHDGKRYDGIYKEGKEYISNDKYLVNINKVKEPITVNGVKYYEIDKIAKYQGCEKLVSRWEDADGRNIMFNSRMPKAAYQLVRTNDKIEISVNVSFSGNVDYLLRDSVQRNDEGRLEIKLTNKKEGDKVKNVSTYKELIRKGFELWSDNYKQHSYNQFGYASVNVEVEILEEDKTRDEVSVRLDVYEPPKNRNMYIRKNRSHTSPSPANWHVGVESTMTLYNHIADANMETTTEEYSEDSFMKIATHEFGHVLGIDDAYDTLLDGRGSASATEEVPTGFPEDGKADIMRAKGHITSNDIEMIFLAYKLDKGQEYKRPNISEAIQYDEIQE